MSYCAVDDVLDAVGLNRDRIIELSDRHSNHAQVDVLISDFITKATREVRKHLGIPLKIHCELHEVDDQIANYQTRVYLGNADESYCEYDEMLDTFNVQGLVVDVLRVYIDGYRVKTTDTTHPWAWTHTAVDDYILFSTTALVDGQFIQVTYTYDPYLISVPVNIEEATACLAGVKLLDMLRGVRVMDTDFDAQSESGVSSPTRDALTITRGQVRKRYLNALASEGYGYDFIPIRGE